MTPPREWGDTPPKGSGNWPTLADVYVLCQRMDTRLAAIEERQSAAKQQQVADRKRLDDHEQRLRALDRRLWVTALVAVLLGTGGGAGVASLMAG